MYNKDDGFRKMMPIVYLVSDVEAEVFASLIQLDHLCASVVHI
jgi:hypothetical protein